MSKSTSIVLGVLLAGSVAANVYLFVHRPSEEVARNAKRFTNRCQILRMEFKDVSKRLASSEDHAFELFIAMTEHRQLEDIGTCGGELPDDGRRADCGIAKDYPCLAALAGRVARSIPQSD